jgi:hypothetical protein
LIEMPLGFEIGRLIGAFQAKEFGQRWGVADFQSQCSVGRIMTLPFARMIVVVTAQLEVPENTLGVDGLSGLALFSRFGLVGGVNPIDGLLEHPAHQLIGRLEHGRAHEDLKLSHGHCVRATGLKAFHHLPDLLVLGQEDFRRRL